MELNTRQTQQGYSQLVLGSGGYQDAFWRITIGSLELQGRSNASGLFNLPAALAANTSFRFEVFDLWHQALTTVDGTTGASGQPTLLQPADTLFFTTDSPPRPDDDLAGRHRVPIVKDQHDPQRRLFLPGKLNLAEDPDGLA